MRIEEQRHGAVTVVKPEGPLIGSDAEALATKLSDVRVASMGRMALDMSATPYVDSEGLAALVKATESMGSSGQVLRLCGVNETIREVLELTELSSLFDHYKDANSAVRSFI